MKARDLRELNEGHLQARVREMMVECEVLQEAVRSGKEKNHARLHQLKRDVARAKTVLREKQGGKL